MSELKFQSSFEYKLIYVFRINDEAHRDVLKIGDATIKTDKDYTELRPSSTELNSAARARIDEYTRTAGINYQLLYTEVAVYKNNNPKSKKYGLTLAFRDHDVHSVLLRSGIERIQFDTHKKQNEWFKCDLETAKKAIQAVKESKSSLSGKDITTDRSPIIFRPEQEEAIEKTLKTFKKSDRMLWNAKMRFGKTLTALEVAKRSSFSRTIIITHRPVVEDGWYDDFKKIFYDKPDYVFGSKDVGEKIQDLIHSDKKFVYFASMQDLRGSEKVGGNFDKNNDIFKIDWDFVVVDEAHEGTQTKLGQAVLQEVIKENNGYTTKTLELSGTPFNLLEGYEDANIYTWDYIMEQEAKKNWALTHFGDSNPYEELPKLNIFTYHLEDTFKNYQEIEDKAFNFREFFRVWLGDVAKDGKHMPAGVKIGDFVHEEDIKAFLDLICKKSDETNYPYSTETYRDYFRHTLWVVPGVKEAKALSALLKSHPVFSQFEIVNVAGEGDEEIDTSDALKAVRKAMTKHPEDTRTITISCGRLTTGVTVPEWTAVLMLAGSYSTAATQYLQTIFRVQSPANINGKIKENCYVFDFAPDRTLMMVAQSVQLSQKGIGNKSAQLRLGAFLNFCPVISISSSSMVTYKVNDLLQQLKKAYVERVVNSGFEDSKLYNDELLKLDDIELQEFDKLKGIIGQTKASDKSKSIDINKEGFTEEEYEELERIQKKPKKELSEEDKKRLEELKEQKKQKSNAISILRGISIRIPLLVYGADVPLTKDITIEAFPDLVDDLSWEEFMPKGVTKEIFKKFSKYYDKDVFVASTYRIRALAKSADDYEPTERIKKIAQIFSTFRNPDKETVLTPWRVVNMHMSDTIGGYDFFDEEHKQEIEVPRFVNHEGVTNKIFTDEGKVLEINSKTGLYPLYIAYTFYRYKLGDKELTLEERLNLWDEVVRDNLFVICKTPMAKQITKRTLLGYRSGKMNAHAFDDLINQLKSKQQQFIDKVSSCNFWNKGGIKMKFSAIVGNPPYQIKNSNLEDQQNASPIYNYFVLSSIKLNPNFVSLIMPSRWMTGGRGLDEFRATMLADKSVKLIHDYPDARDCFSNVEIKGGVCYLLWDKNYIGNVKYVQHKDGQINAADRNLDDLNIGMFVRDTEALSIINKVIKSKDFVSFESIAGSQTPFGIVTSFKDYTNEPTAENSMKIYGNKFVGYTSMKFVTKNSELAYKYKVLAPKAVGSGDISSDKIHPFVADNPSICTQTYIIYGAYDNRLEAENLCDYMKTKFFHFLLGQLKNTQQMAPNLFKFVPLLDFKQSWNDKKLYEKYNLSETEIGYINSIVWSNSKVKQ
jgi:superfamily II DNA or RNA helicase